MDFQLDRREFDSAPGHHEIKYLTVFWLEVITACPQYVRIYLAVALALTSNDCYRG
jgi:hypothetical protein